MIFVTHDQVEAMTLADRIVVMNDRKIEQIGTPMEIYARPATSFVAGFVGSPAMNFVRRHCVDRRRRRRAAPAGRRTESHAGLPCRASCRRWPSQLGIRAEDVRDRPAGQGNAGGTVEVRRAARRPHPGLCPAAATAATVVAEDAGNSRVAVGDTVGLAHRRAPQSHLFDADRPRLRMREEATWLTD